MAYLKSKKTQNILYLTIILMLITFFALYNLDSDAHKEFPIGIWQTIYEDKVFGIEFMENGCALMFSEGEGEIIPTCYVIDFQKQPWHIDLEFLAKYPPIKAIFEKIDDDKIRIQLPLREDTRPADFTDESITLNYAKKYIRFLSMSIDEYNEALNQGLMMESIWFEGKNHQELLEICEALFRHQFTNNASGQQENAPTYYLSIYNADPPEDLIARFQNNNIPVRPGSEFQMGSGLLFKISSIKLINKRNTQIEGGYYEGPTSSSGNTYILKKKGQVWEVVSDTMNWIS